MKRVTDSVLMFCRRPAVKKAIAVAILPLPVILVVGAVYLWKYFTARPVEIRPAVIAAPLTKASKVDRDTQRITYIPDAELIRQDPERVYPRTLTGIRVDVSKLQQVINAARWW